jgi:hypothetical protein
MATTAAIKAGRAYVEVGTDQSSLEKGLLAAEQKLKSFGAAIMGIGGMFTAIGGAITAPFIAGLKGAMDLEDAMQATGVIFGDSADIVIKKSEEMAAASRVVKSDFLIAANSFGAVFKGVGKTQKEAANLGNMLTELGIDMASFGTNVNQEEAFMALRAAFRSEYDPIERFNVFITAAKVENEALAMGLAKTKDGITEYAKKQAVLNLILKQTKDQQGDQLRSVNTAKGVWVALTNTLKNLSTELGSAIAPVLVSIGKVMVTASQDVVTFAKANKGLLLTIFAVGAGIAAVGATLVGLGAVIWGLGAVFGVLTSAVSAVGAVFGFILSPIGLIVVAIGGAVAAFLMFTDAGQSTLSWLGEAFAELQADATTAFTGIGDALKSGNIMLAAQILWAFLKVEWLKGVNFLKQVWNDWGSAIVTAFRDVSYKLSSLMIDGWAMIRTAGIEAGGALVDIFIGTIGNIRSAWATFSSWFANMWDTNVAVSAKQLIDLGGLVKWELEKIKSLFSGTAFDAEAHGKRMKKVTDQIAAEKAAVDEDLKAKKDARAAAAGNIGKETQEELDKRAVARAEELKKIEDERIGSQEALAGMRKQELDQRAADAAAAMAPAEAELQAAKDELAKLTTQAADEVLDEAANEEAFEATTKAKVPLGLDAEGLDKAIGQTKAKVEATGSFSASALAGLGVGSTIQDEQLDEQKKAVKELEKLNKKKAVFA